MSRQAGKERDTDYDVRALLTSKELRKFDPKRKDHIAVLEARQQEWDRRKAQGMKVPDRMDDWGDGRHNVRPDKR